jgi:hypothetical protein
MFDACYIAGRRKNINSLKIHNVFQICAKYANKLLINTELRQIAHIYNIKTRIRSRNKTYFPHKYEQTETMRSEHLHIFIYRSVTDTYA